MVLPSCHSPCATHRVAARSVCHLQIPARRQCCGSKSRPHPPLRWQVCTRRHTSIDAAVQEDTALELDQPDTIQRVARRHTGLARQILSRPEIEGEPLKFLRSMEAYWSVSPSLQTSLIVLLSPSVPTYLAMLKLPSVQGMTMFLSKTDLSNSLIM